MHVLIAMKEGDKALEEGVDRKGFSDKKLF